MAQTWKYLLGLRPGALEGSRKLLEAGVCLLANLSQRRALPVDSPSFQTPSLPKLSQGLLPNTSLTRSCFLSLQDILSHVINTEPHISRA